MSGQRRAIALSGLAILVGCGAVSATDRGSAEAAAKTDNVAGVQAYLSAGHPASEGDVRGNTLLHVAARAGSAKVIELLLRSGANVNARTADVGTTPLHVAAGDGRRQAVELLLSAGRT